MKAESLLDNWLPGGLTKSYVICSDRNTWTQAARNLQPHFPKLKYFQAYNLRNRKFKKLDDFEDLPFPVGVVTKLDIIRSICPRRHENLTTSGALGCSMSHLKIWDMCKDLPGWTLIFESDARTEPQFAEKLETIMKHAPPDDDVNSIRLSYNDKFKVKNIKVPGNCFNRHVSGYTFGNDAYLVRNSALRQFFKFHLPVQFQIDCLMFMMAQLGVGGPIWKVSPWLRLFRPFKHPSSTNYGLASLIQLYPDSRNACNIAIIAPYIGMAVLLVAIMCILLIPKEPKEPEPVKPPM